MESEKIYGVYETSILHKNVTLKMNEIGKQVKENLEMKLNNTLLGKCISEGFIKPNSIKIVSYSSGLVSGESVVFKVVFECKICNPVEGMQIECYVKNITKAGLSCESVNNDDGYNPINAFVARDHYYSDNYFNSITENSKIIISVIGSRFELNDPYIVVIGKLKYDKQDKQEMKYDKLKPTINIL
tara:strand:- start:18 stop:575 length:558 start_codon:yes stop_codon:yes gene_type:complete